MKQTIIYLGNFMIPDGNAAGKRVYANGLALRRSGYKVVFLGYHKGDEARKTTEIDGITSYSLNYDSGIRRLFDLMYLRELEKVLEDCDRVDAVILYSAMGTMHFNEMVITLCRKKGIKTVFDFTDFYDKPERRDLLRYYLKKRDNIILKSRVLRKVNGVVAISLYGKMFAGNPNTVVVPPLSIRTTPRDLSQLSSDITFSYASIPTDHNRPVTEWKDRIDAIIDAFCEVKRSGISDFHLNMIGFREDNLLDMFLPQVRELYRKKLGYLRENISFYGVLSNAEAQQVILGSHYSILLRTSMTCTNVGFPTKVSESMSLGVPVIANDTSDLGYYINDGKNGFMIDAPENITAIAESLISIIHSTKEIYPTLVMNLERDKPFAVDHFVETLGDFMRRLLENE